MNIDNIEERIEELKGQLFKNRKSTQRLYEVVRILDVLYIDLETHRKKMKKEHEDVLKLEKIASYTLFSMILGDKREQLEKERQEYLQAVLEYNSIAHEIKVLRFEEEVLRGSILEEDDIQKKLDYYLKVKEQKILFHNSELALPIKKLNADIDHLKTFIREIDEAKTVNRKLEILLKKARAKLKGIEDFHYKKILSPRSRARKKIVDSAIIQAAEINILINRLDKELSDIYTQYVFFNIYKYQNFVDSFYDNLITDWVTKNKLQNAMGSLDTAISHVKRIKDTLENDRKKAADRIEEKIREKRSLVANAN